MYDSQRQLTLIVLSLPSGQKGPHTLQHLIAWIRFKVRSDLFVVCQSDHLLGLSAGFLHKEGLTLQSAGFLTGVCGYLQTWSTPACHVGSYSLLTFLSRHVRTLENFLRYY